MRMRGVALGLVGGLLAAASARADCHDPKYTRHLTDPTYARGTTIANRPCAVPFHAYRALLGGSTIDRIPNLKELLTTEVRLTGTDGATTLNVFGRDAVYKALQDTSGTAYAVDNPDGGHLKIRHGLFGLAKTTLESMAELRWEGRITKGGQTRTEEVTAVLLETSEDEKTGWKIVSLHIKRQSLRR